MVSGPPNKDVTVIISIANKRTNTIYTYRQNLSLDQNGFATVSFYNLAPPGQSGDGAQVLGTGVNNSTDAQGPTTTVNTYYE